MRIEKLELKNVCQHEHLEWRFEPGLVGVFGPNGSGKSNALNVAAYAALTNDYSRHPQGKSGMIRQQAGVEGKSYIRLEFVHEGHKAVLERGLQKPARHRLAVDGREELRKAVEIQEVIESSLGISRQLIDRYMFVGQDDLYAFLSDTPAVRAQSFAHLCGTTHAERCWELLGEFINADQALAIEVTDTTDELRTKVAASERKLRQERKTLAEARSHRLSAEQREELEQLIVDAERMRQLKDVEIDQLLADEAEKFERAKAAKAKEKEAATKLSEAEVSLSAAEREAAEAETAIKAYDEQAKAWKRLLDARRVLVEAEEACEKVLADEPARPKLAGDPESLEEERSELEAELKRVRQTLRALARGDVTECPLCGTPVSDFKEHLAELKKREEQIPARLRVVMPELAKHAMYQEAVEDWEKRKQKAEWEVKRCRSIVDSLKETPRPRKIDRKSLGDLVARRDELRRLVKDLRRASQAASQKFAAAKAEHIAAKKKRVQAGRELAELQSRVTLTELSVAKEAIEEDKRWAETEAGAARGIELLEDSLTQAKEELRRVEQRLAKQRRAVSWVEDLQAVRDEVMHRDKLPAVVHRNALLNMEEAINDSLELFDSPFYVEPDESLGFLARFPNGTRMPAVGLSGGQKVMLALSFRLAVSSLFASQVGMMILDEPTDGLDVDNRRLAAGVFRRLGGIAKDRGYQIIVITHDDLLVPAFDQTFELAASE